MDAIPTCHGRVALITGSGRGIGRSTALTLAREGSAIVVNYLQDDVAASDLVDHIRARGGIAVAIRADVHRSDDCHRLVAEATQSLGPVDICIVSPGAEWRMGPVHKIEPVGAVEDVRREVAPLFELLPLVLPGMYERKWGRLIGMSMQLNHAYNVHALSYEAGKAARTAAIRFTRDQAFHHNVTVNVVAPGPVAKPETLAQAIELCDHGPAWHNRPDLSAQDIAEGIAFLCSDAGRHVTGCELSYVPHKF